MPPTTNTQVPISMTRVQYQQKYGTLPPVQSASKSPVISSATSTSAPIQMTRAQYQAKYGSAPVTAPQSPQPQPTTGGIGGVVKSLIGAPATILARPIQAGAELFGASADQVNNVTNKLTDGIVAPVPQNLSDVKKDVGRGVETVAFGLGPLAGGAAFGTGNSLEQGNDLFSAQTAFQTVLGLGAGKVLDLVGKPLLNATGKVIGKITPEVLNDVASKGIGAIQDFAAQHNLLPKVASDAVNAGAEGLEKLANKPFQIADRAATSIGNGIASQYPSLGSPTEEKFNTAINNVADTYKKVLPLTPTQQAKEASLLAKTGDNAYTTMARNGIVPGTSEAPEKLQQISDLYKNATDKAKANESAYFNADEIKKNAFASIDDTLSSETERNAAKDKVSEEVNALVQKNPEKVRLGPNGETKISADLQERLRKTGNDWAQYNKLNPDSVKNATGRGLADAVRDQVDKEGTFPAYREANKEWGKVIHAQDVLQGIEKSGKSFKTPGGFTGSITRKVLSGLLGYHVGGVGGAILSELGSEYGAKIISNPELRTYFDRQIIEKFSGKDATPEAISRLEQQIKDFIDKRETMKALPPPSYIPMGGPSQSGVISPRLTSADDLLAAQKATGTVQRQKLLNSPGRNPIRLKGK